MSDSVSSIVNDEHDTDDVSAFLANLTGDDESKRRASTDEGDDKGDATEGDETTSEAGEASDESGEAEGEPEGDAETDPDDQEFDIKVGEEVKKAKLKDLKRLYGQEASLTQKSQKLAESQRASDARHQLATTALTNMLEKAQKNADQYSSLDFFSLTAQVGAGTLDQATFDALRGDKAAADAEVKFIREELGGLMQQKQQADAAAYREAATECMKVLSDEKTGIKGWGKDLYDGLTQFAVEQGIPKAMFTQLTNPGAIKVVWQAQQWMKAEAARKAAEAKVVKAPNKPTKVLRPGSNTSNGKGSSEAMRALRKSGSTEDATEAFLKSF